MVLAGVPRSLKSGSMFRRWLGVMLLSGGIALVYTWWILVRISGFLTLLLVSAVAAGVIYMLATSRRERRGAERFAISPSGIARIGLDGGSGAPAMHDVVFVPWGDADAMDLQRLSNVWRRLRIGRRGNSGRLSSVVFDAGFRCPDGSEPAVREELERCLAGKPLTTSPPNAA